ncbi:hypothetical protein [Metaclostridioides mangenotii]|uniref:hypothetical protein n=1 Tax=Metaclostridioides mangenotii TaxID=1540 RepID=UPI00163B5996|nr:hypothetical protein [Clostridioides mangenotii]
MEGGLFITLKKTSISCNVFSVTEYDATVKPSVRCGETTYQVPIKNVIKFYLYERTVSA